MRPRSPRSPFTLILPLFLLLAACDNPAALDATDDSADLTVMADLLTQELSLDAAQQQDVRAVLSHHQARRHDPALLWYVAADLQAKLTDAQKALLFDLAEQLQGRGLAGGFADPAGWQRPGRPHGPGQGRAPEPGGAFFDDLLTDEQEAAVREIRDRYRAQIEALADQRRDGTLTQEAFREAVQALQAAMKEEIDALLTDEQKAEIEARRAERQAEMEAWLEAHRAEMEARAEAVRAAMQAALALTDEQADALTTLFTEQREARRTLFDQFRDGAITEEALQAELEALHVAEETALQELLDDRQFEIVQIHRALVALRGRAPGRQGPGSRPGQGGPGGGFGGAHNN